VLGAGELIAAPLGIGQRRIERLLGSGRDVNRAGLGGYGSAAELSAQPIEQHSGLKAVDLLKGGSDETVGFAE
jgi:hypothetical protein